LPNGVASVAGCPGFHGNKEPILWCACDCVCNETPLDIVTSDEISVGTQLQNASGQHTTWHASTALVKKNKKKYSFVEIFLPQSLMVPGK